jgi:hypothetical protein
VLCCAETPKKTAGHLSSQKVAGQEFYARAGEAASWMDNANFALYAPKNNVSATESTFVFGTNSAPVLSEDGHTWTLDVTLIPAVTESIYGSEVAAFNPTTFPMVSTFAPAALFVDNICYLYNRWTGRIYFWWFCY